jgi:hypothetical protein
VPCDEGLGAWGDLVEGEGRIGVASDYVFFISSLSFFVSFSFFVLFVFCIW